MPQIYDDACEAITSIKMVSKDASSASPWLKTILPMMCLALAAAAAYYSRSTPHIFWNTYIFGAASSLGMFFVLVVIWTILRSILGWFEGEKNDQLALKKQLGPLAIFHISKKKW